MRIPVAIMLPMLLSAADFPIDHVTVAGSDVHKLQAGLAAVGIPSVYGGAHNNKTTEMALVSLPDGAYLELMGLQQGADPRLVDQHVWAKFLKADAGPCAWALRAPNLAAEVQRLKTAGIEVSAPVASGRERPDGVRLNWETSDIGSDVRGTFFPFLIHDLTPRDQRAFPQGKPGTLDFRKITRVVIAVRDLDAAISRYRHAFAVAAAVQQVDEAFGGRIAVFDGAPVVLAQPLAADSWLAARLAQFGEAPCAFVLGAARPDRYQGSTKSRWSGADISWFDAEKLGWRLGFEWAP